MLSRRRSSEQASHSNQSTPAATRVENALRNVQILFSTAIIPDTQRPNLPRPPDQSGELPQNDTSAMRRLFNRDQRPRKPAVHTLVVASARNSTLRLYHVVDAARVTHRFWNLTELHKIDGLGAPVAESFNFALYFSTSKPVTFRTSTPRERAIFLWSLLQICVSRLKRAPPVTNLRLLDLQTFAEREEDDHLSNNYPSNPNLRVQASLEELPLSDLPTGRSEASINRSPPVLTSSPKPGDRPEDGDRSSDPRLKPRERPRTPSRMQKVTRTMSEPKAMAMQSVSDDSEEHRQPASTETGVRDMNIDERAFLAAAKRMGANKSFEMGRYGSDHFSSVGSDPKARLFHQRIKPSDANTAKVVAERRLQQEKKQFRLSMEEQMDLLLALELFGNSRQERPLHEFGTWADQHIQTLEAENIADLVNVEKHAPEYDVRENTKETSKGHGVQRERNPQDVLIESMMFAEPWLERCQTLLNPYARLAEDLKRDITNLERRRRNVQSLEEELDGLLKALTFDQTEEALISELDTISLPSDLPEVNYLQFQGAVQLVTDKAAAVSRLPCMSEMVVVKGVQKMITEKQNNASAALLPLLKKYLRKRYNADDSDNFVFSFNEPWMKDSEENRTEDTAEFLRGAECLAVCGNNSFVDLVDHYVNVSSAWIMNIIRFLMQEDVGQNMVKATLDSRAKLFSENVLYVCIVEGMRAFRLFASILDSLDRDGFISISAILRRQIPDFLLVEEYVTSQAEGNKSKQACINLHFSQSLDFFAEQVNRGTDEELQAILSRVELRNGVKLSTESSPDKNNRKEAPIADRKITRNDRVVRESVSNFLVVCNEISLTCQALLERHISDVIAGMEVPHDVSTQQGRAAFFSRVREAVDLCCELSLPTFYGLGSSDRDPNSALKTKALCERLVAAAMRSTEVASTAGPENVTESIKLQCYGYIASKLEEGKREEFLIQMAHLSSRLRKHVITNWADAAVFEAVLGNLQFNGDKPTTENYSRFRNSVMELTAQTTSNRIKEAINETMESAADTGAILPFYGDMISLLKEKMEDVLRKVRKDKAVSDVRPKLLSFSRELLSSLRGEQKRLFEIHTHHDY